MVRRSSTLLGLGMVLILFALSWSALQTRRNAREEARLRTRLSTFVRLSPLPTFELHPTYTPTETLSPTATGKPASSPIPPATITPTSCPTPSPTPSFTPAPPVRLLIPALDVDVRVVPVSSYLVEKDGHIMRVWKTADYAAGYHENGAYPGLPGNVVISGHNNIKGSVFRPLSLLGNKGIPFPRGAKVYLVDAQGRIYEYEMTELLKVDTRDARARERGRRWLWATRDPVLTLVTCWPPNNNTYRLLIRARYVGMKERRRE